MPRIVNHAIHWAGSTEFGLFNPRRVFVMSGTGMFMTDNVDASMVRKGTVPLNAGSVPGGPSVRVIGDSDGFGHTDLARPPNNGTHPAM